MSQELLTLAREVAAEKKVDPETVLRALERAIEEAYKKEKIASDVTVKIDPSSGDVRILMIKRAVPEVSDPAREISIEEAKKYIDDPKVGEEIPIPMELNEEFGRVAAQAAKQVFLGNLRKAMDDARYDYFQTRKGDIIVGRVLKLTPKGYLIEFEGRGEGFLPFEETPPNSNFKPGEKIRVLVKDVEKDENTGKYRVILSRNDVRFIEKLFEIEIPEIGQHKVVEIVSIVRKPGNRVKVAVRSKRPEIDPVGACVGENGKRIQEIRRELRREKVDIVKWSDKPEEYIAAAIFAQRDKKGQVKVEIEDPDEKRAIAYVEDKELLKKAVGEGGRNVFLAEKLTGWKITIKDTAKLSEEEEERINEELRSLGLNPENREEVIARIKEIFRNAGVDNFKTLVELDENKELTAEVMNRMRDVLGKIPTARAFSYMKSVVLQTFIDGEKEEVKEPGPEEESVE